MSNRFTEIAEKGLNNAVGVAEGFGHTYIGSEHILLSIAKEKSSSAAAVLLKNGIDDVKIENAIKEYSGVGARTKLSPKDMSPRARKIVENAYRVSLRHSALRVGTEHILLSIIEEGENVGLKLLKNMSEDFSSLSEDVLEAVRKSVQRVDVKRAKKEDECALSQYGRNLTELARKKMLDPVIGRELETERLIRILSRKTKNNPCLIGEAGVGKTAIVEGLAQRIADGNVPEALKCKKVVSVDLTSMIAGAKYRGDFEERIKNLINEARRDKSIILFIDEIHTIVGAGGAEGAIDASNILKPQLARAEIQLIGATTYAEYRKYIEKDAALERRFQTVKVDEPSRAATLEILFGIRAEYEKHHRLKISDEALDAVVSLSVRYIPNKFLPDKAIDVLDESCAKVNAKIQNTSDTFGQNFSVCDSGKPAERVLTKEDVVEAVSEITGITISAGDGTVSEIEREILKTVRGQNVAIHELCSAVAAAEIGLFSQERPRGIFLLLGESGCGKTLLAKELSRAISHKNGEFIRYDMSEFKEPSSISKLIGSPPGYVGYQDGGTLTEHIRRQPYSVILFDEIEKADKDVQNLILQMLDRGVMHDSSGKMASFKDAYVIFTSALWKSSRTQSGFILPSENSTPRELPSEFKGDFINRIDRVIYLSALSDTSLFEIASDTFLSLKERLSELGASLDWSEDVLWSLARTAVKEGGGARTLLKNIKRVFEENIIDYVAEYRDGKIYCNLLDGKIKVEFENKKAQLCQRA